MANKAVKSALKKKMNDEPFNKEVAASWDAVEKEDKEMANKEFKQKVEEKMRDKIGAEIDEKEFQVWLKEHNKPKMKISKKTSSNKEIKKSVFKSYIFDPNPKRSK